MRDQEKLRRLWRNVRALNAIGIFVAALSTLAGVTVLVLLQRAPEASREKLILDGTFNLGQMLAMHGFIFLIITLGTALYTKRIRKIYDVEKPAE